VPLRSQVPLRSRRSVVAGDVQPPSLISLPATRQRHGCRAHVAGTAWTRHSCCMPRYGWCRCG